MARGENPGHVLSFEAHSTLVYDKDANYGHASAGEDLAISFDGTDGKARLGADNAKFQGKFLSLSSKGEVSVMATGVPMILRKSAATIAKGNKILCAGNGKVKAGTGENARGNVIEILDPGDNGHILVIMPA